MNFNVIVAMDRNGVIGKAGGLPWPKFPADLARFKQLTTGHIVLMGRKTWDSIPEKFRPLPERYSFVVSRDKSLAWEGQRLVPFVRGSGRLPCHSCDVGDHFAQIDSDLDRSLRSACDLASTMNSVFPERRLAVWCIGGAETYARFLTLAASTVVHAPERHSLRLFVTRIDAEFEGDTRWPAAWQLQDPELRLDSEEKHTASDAFPFPFTFSEHTFVAIGGATVSEVKAP